MTETIMPKELVEALKPDYIAPLVLYLVHDSCPESGSLYEVGAGYIAKDRWERSEGVLFRPSELTPENVKANWNKIVDFTRSTHPTSTEEFMARVMDNIANPESAKPAEHKVETSNPKETKQTPSQDTQSSG
jgi:hypothetical protein